MPPPSAFSPPLGLVIALAFVTIARAEAPPPPPYAKKTIGEAVALIREARGNVVLFHVFASWCPACREQLPVLNKLSTRYQKHPFKLLALSVDEDPAALAKFLTQHPVRGQPLRLVPGTQEFSAALQEAGMTEFKAAVPYTAVFDLRGRCVGEFTGVTDYRTLCRCIDDVYRAASARAEPVGSDSPTATPEKKGGRAAPQGKFSAVSAATLAGAEEDDSGPRGWLGLARKHKYYFGTGAGALLLIAAGIFLQICQGFQRRTPPRPVAPPLKVSPRRSP